MYNLIFAGRPGSGKGTQAKLLAEHFNIPHISTGDIFRDHVERQTPLGKAITESMKAGHYTSDDITNQVVKERLQEADCANGFILDGYPRTLNQVHFLQDESIRIDYVLNIEVAEIACVERLLNRAKSGGRADDTQEVIQERMNIYTQTMDPVLNHYSGTGQSVLFDGDRQVADIQKDMVQFLESVS